MQWTYEASKMWLLILMNHRLMIKLTPKGQRFLLETQGTKSHPDIQTDLAIQDLTHEKKLSFRQKMNMFQLETQGKWERALKIRILPVRFNRSDRDQDKECRLKDKCHPTQGKERVTVEALTADMD